MTTIMCQELDGGVCPLLENGQTTHMLQNSKYINMVKQGVIAYSMTACTAWKIYISSDKKGC